MGWRKHESGWFLCPPAGYECARGERIDRRGRLWRKPPIGWLPEGPPPWSTRVRVRPEVFWEPVRAWQERQAAGGRGVWPLRVALDPAWRARWGPYRRTGPRAVPRQRFPAGERAGVWGWRAQVVAWYWAVAWPEVGLGRPMSRRVRGLVNKVGRGERPWTVGLDKAIAEEVARVRRLRVARRVAGERAAARKKGARVQVGLLTGRLTVGR